MLLRRFSGLAILMVALSETGAIAAPEPYKSDRFEQIVAQRGPGGGGGHRAGKRQGRGQRGDRWIEQLNLTDDQRQEIEQIRQQSQSEFEQLHEQIHQAREQMRELMGSNGSDGQLRSQHQQMQQLRQRMGNLRFEQMLKIRGILTEEQRRELAENMQQRQQNGHNGGGRGQGRGQR